MKKRILIFLSILLIVQFAKAQAPVFDTCQNLPQYDGEWRYINGIDTLKIYLRDHRFSSVSDNGSLNVYDRLWGWIDYRSGTTVIESNYQHRFSIIPQNYDYVNFSMWLHMPECNDSWLKLRGFMWDSQTQKKYFDIDVVINPAKTIMTWKLKYPEGYNLIAGTEYNYFLPKEFVLIKQ